MENNNCSIKKQFQTKSTEELLLAKKTAQTKFAELKLKAGGD